MKNNDGLAQMKRDNKTILSMFIGLCVGLPLNVFLMHFHEALHLSLVECAVVGYLSGMASFFLAYRKLMLAGRAKPERRDRPDDGA